MLRWLACHSPKDAGEWHKRFTLFSESSSCYKRLASCTGTSIPTKRNQPIQCHHGLVEMLSSVLSSSLVHYEHQSYSLFWRRHSKIRYPSYKTAWFDRNLDVIERVAIGYKFSLLTLSYMLTLLVVLTCMWLVHCSGGVCTDGCMVKEKLTMNVF